MERVLVVCAVVFRVSDFVEGIGIGARTVFGE